MSEHCFHCGLEIKHNYRVTSLINEDEKHFCCSGCQSACQAIFRVGLESFYQKTADNPLLSPPKEIQDPTLNGLYDSDEVQADYVTRVGDSSRILLLVESIHCAACVWLIEQTLSRIDGVLSVQVNLTDKQLRLEWDHRKVNLSLILATCQEIGYLALPFNVDIAEQQHQTQQRHLLYRLSFAGFTMMNMLWISIALYSGAEQDQFKTWFYTLGLILATPTLFYSGYPFLRNALIGIKYRHLTMDLPIALGLSITYGYSLYIVVLKEFQGPIYFDTVVNLIFIILVARYLESAARKKALSQSNRLNVITPKVARLITSGQIEVVPLARLKRGDRVLIHPGEIIPIDGRVVSGESSADESILTGESAPVVKRPDTQVIAGSTNIDKQLEVITEKTISETRYAKLIEIMLQTKANKATIQMIADRIVPWFVLLTLTIACLAWLYWQWADPEKALLIAVSVLMITCPCALGLATPLAIAVATGKAAHQGILVKNAQAFEELAEAKVFCFDKTGTLTRGELSVEQFYAVNEAEKLRLLQIAASIEQYSEHNIAKAIVAMAKSKHLNLHTVKQVEAYPGLGIQAQVKSERILLGSQTLLKQIDIAISPDWLERAAQAELAARSVLFIVEQNQITGMLSFSDTVREESKAMVQQLKQQNMSVQIISGDREQVVEVIADHLGVKKASGLLLPEDKVLAIKDEQKNQKRVVMIGDGINDAPAIAQADVGITLASASGLAREAADIVLPKNNLQAILATRDLSRKTLTIIKQNLLLSITYNIIMVPLAVMGMVTPWVAAVTMPLSSLCVIVNTVRLKR